MKRPDKTVERWKSACDALVADRKYDRAARSINRPRPAAHRGDLGRGALNMSALEDADRVGRLGGDALVTAAPLLSRAVAILIIENRCAFSSTPMPAR
jgi:hypothetical protein